jgi:spore coat protein H
MNNRLKFLILFFLSFSVYAQPGDPGGDPPGGEPVATEEYIFRPDELSIIRLTLSPEDKAFLLDPDNAESEVYLPAVFEMSNSQMDTTLSFTVGVRLRGNTSRYHNKKPFKIDFREFGGEKFFGYKKFNLKSNVNDPSQVREPLTLLYYREMGVPAARTHPLRLYMNDEYMGVYSNVEQIDDEFLDLRYGHEDGFLYKCFYGANLLDNGQVFNTGMYESEINTDLDTRAELDHFVGILNNTATSNFPTEIEKVFEVDRYLRQLAVEAMLGHWDGYSYNQNNYYLFYNGQTGKIEFIPYDVDNTWGIDWLGKDWATRDLNNWAKTDQPRPLTTRILSITTYRKKYETYLSTLAEKYFREDYLIPKLDLYKAILDEAIQEDTYFDDTFGFTYTDFLNSFTEGMDNHVTYGIMEYLQVRTQAALEQRPDLITAVDNDPSLVSQVYPNPSHSPKIYISTNHIPTVNPIVYSSTGQEIPVQINYLDNQRAELSLPNELPFGLYIIQFNNTLHRWIYH